MEFTLSIGAITGGPLLAPPIWALFSKRLTGKATLLITIVSLLVNLLFKMILPFVIDYKLSRGNEMLLGVLLPAILLVIYELYAASKGSISLEYADMQQRKLRRKQEAVAVSEEELSAVRRQNKFGLRIIAFSLAFTAVLLYVLSALTTKASGMVAGIATVILVLALIPWFNSRKIKV